MAGDILNMAIRDANKYVRNGGFQSEILLASPNGQNTVELTGFHTRHYLGFDEDGRLLNSKSAHISFSEEESIEKGFVIRDNGNEVSLKGYKITVSTPRAGQEKYVIKEAYPNDTFGVIVCILGDYEDN